MVDRWAGQYYTFYDSVRPSPIIETVKTVGLAVAVVALGSLVFAVMDGDRARSTVNTGGAVT